MTIRAAHLTRRALLTAFVASLLAVSLTGAGVPAGKPEAVGMSAERLQRIHQVVGRAMDAKEICRRRHRRGAQGTGRALRGAGPDGPRDEARHGRDAIFPIASMSKPITGVAILMLVEEGKVRLTDPVSRFIPEFKDTKVAIVKPGGPAGAGRRGPAAARAGDLHGAGDA